MFPRLSFSILSFTFLASVNLASGEKSQWKKHELHVGHGPVRTAIPGDFTNDGIPDIIASSDGRTILFAGPEFRPVVIHAHPDHEFIHSEAFDVDGDGDLDFIGARHRNPAVFMWFEQPENPLLPWVGRSVSDKLSGIHSLATADLDRDGDLDLLATSAIGERVDSRGNVNAFPVSLVWLRVPDDPLTAREWEAFAFADRDAPGFTHYLGVGDINRDGRLDAAVGAKVGDFPDGRYFAWWEAPEETTRPWKKHLIPEEHDGATHIYPADVDGDGAMDFIASRGHGRGVFWLKGPEWKEQAIHPEIEEPHALLVFDMEGDGDWDAAVCAFGSKESWWYENDGYGNFNNRFVTGNQEAYDVRAHDLDQDGDLDLVIAGNGSKNVIWCENPAR